MWHPPHAHEVTGEGQGQEQGEGEGERGGEREGEGAQLHFTPKNVGTQEARTAGVSAGAQSVEALAEYHDFLFGAKGWGRVQGILAVPAPGLGLRVIGFGFRVWACLHRHTKSSHSDF